MADPYKNISDSISKTEKAQNDIANKIKDLISELKAQTKQQKETADGADGLVKELKALIKEHQAQNKLIRDEYNEIKTQNKYLREQNEAQEKEIHRGRIWQTLAWVITTIIAIGAVVVPLVDLIHNW